MSSNRAANPVKLFIDVLAMEDVGLEERLEEKLFSEYGPSDHRMILIPSGKTIHRVFLSFDQLIEIGDFPKARTWFESTAREFSSQIMAGVVEKRRVFF